MRTILAIGGAVIKTAWDEIKEAARRKKFDVLIHNGASLFHDFQRATEDLDGKHSHTLDELYENYWINEKASELVWEWILTGKTPSRTLTRICKEQEIDVLLSIDLAKDFWQIFKDYTYWERLGRYACLDFKRLCIAMEKPFRFINMGSSVGHPELFTKAIAVAKPTDFRADVVDFLPNQYRPKTRVARFGKYYQMEHKEFLIEWLAEEK